VVLLNYQPKLGGWWGAGERKTITIDIHPFAHGTFHSVHTARLGDQRVVVKFARHAADRTREAAMAQLEAQLRASHWAQQFNRRAAAVGAAHRVEYASIVAIELPEQQDWQWGDLALLEPFMPGEFQKFNDNSGGVFGGMLAQVEHQLLIKKVPFFG